MDEKQQEPQKQPYGDNSRFHAHEVAKEAARSIGPDVLRRIKAEDPDTAKQLKKAIVSMVLNIGEGRRRVGGDRKHLFRIAFGSAEESRDALEIAQAWEYVPPGRLDRTLELLDRVLAMLWKLTR